MLHFALKDTRLQSATILYYIKRLLLIYNIGDHTGVPPPPQYLLSYLTFSATCREGQGLTDLLCGWEEEKMLRHAMRSTSLVGNAVWHLSWTALLALLAALLFAIQIGESGPANINQSGSCSNLCTGEACTVHSDSEQHCLQQYAGRSLLWRRLQPPANNMMSIQSVCTGTEPWRLGKPGRLHAL